MPTATRDLHQLLLRSEKFRRWRVQERKPAVTVGRGQPFVYKGKPFVYKGKRYTNLMANELEAFKEKPNSPTIEQACAAYLQDAKARELREPTLYKFKLLFRQLKEFAANEGLVFVSDFTVDSVRRFRAS